MNPNKIVKNILEEKDERCNKCYNPYDECDC
jgi:hypothetical protein